ncbi:hypothetical protein TNIN_423041 [Trichonephila inaurata madagascariensis]|uniref:Uncharacterized protein n=1 Tax=Trichonephila inaurata madagascariensis TaxID=2747483 RepID=A0A8X6Y8I8_9ARAC|nr:hypothetical protein TNIN_423041 [Trichonephila inaurata madagascariensis]
MDDKPCKLSADTELLISEVTDSLKEASLETDSGSQKLTTKLDGKSETLLLQVIPILESLYTDITNSLRLSRKDKFMTTNFSISTCNSTTEEETDTDAESAPSTSSEKTGTVAEENHECSACNLFYQLESLSDMQECLIVIRHDLKNMVNDLLVLCNEFESCDFRKIEYTLGLFNDLVKERDMTRESYGQGLSFHLTADDPMGALRVSSEMMFLKLLLLENDKYIQTFKTVQFLMTQLMRSRKFLQKEEVSSGEVITFIGSDIAHLN